MAYHRIHNLLRRVIAGLAMRSLGLSLLSILISIIGLLGATYYIPSIFSGLKSDPSNSILQLQAIGLIALLFIVVRSIFGDLQSLVGPKTTIEIGTSIKDSHYDFFKLFDHKCRDIFIIGQNLRTLLSNSGVWDHLQNLVSANEDLKIHIVLTVPEAMDTIDDVARREYTRTVAELVKFIYRKLAKKHRQQIAVSFHPGATSLSAFIRDPHSKSRGILVFVPKWATDREPGNRVFCVVRKWENFEIFNKLFGHISIMTGQRALSLEDVAAKVGVPIPKG